MVALGKCVSRLLGKHAHELFEWSSRDSNLELYSNICAFNQIRGERRIVKRVVPVPALTSFIIVSKDPL